MNIERELLSEKTKMENNGEDEQIEGRIIQCIMIMMTMIRREQQIKWNKRLERVKKSEKLWVDCMLF